MCVVTEKEFITYAFEEEFISVIHSCQIKREK
jgi:hypothetical protein